MVPEVGAIQAMSANMLGAANGVQGQMQTQFQTGLPGLSMADGAANGITDGSAPMPFADLMTDAVGEVNRLQDTAKAAVKGLMTGTGVDVHEAMIATQKASMAFELSLAVRNKAVQAYQSVMSMQF
jgi:flagellar hook-basal body complex protein FliE